MFQCNYGFNIVNTLSHDTVHAIDRASEVPKIFCAMGFQQLDGGAKIKQNVAVISSSGPP